MHKKIHRSGGCRMKSYLNEDIEQLAEMENVLADLRGKNILVTGASGLLGSIIVKSLCAYEKKCKSGLQVYALVRSRVKAEKIFERYLDNGILKVVVSDVNKKISVDDRLNYIIHAASITDSKLFVSKPVETINTLINGTKNLLELGKEHQIDSFLFLSSLEVYGKPDENYQVDEKYVGYIDFSAVRSSYSEGKRMAECLCTSYFKEYGVPVKVARLSQTFGPGVDYNDGRVFAEFARCVMKNQDIGLNTAGRTYRNYCYTRDAVAAIFYILTKGAAGEAYNVANKNTGITIADMAHLVSEDLGQGRIKVRFNNPEELQVFGYNPEMKIELVTEKLEKLGWRAEVDLEQMFVRMIHDMKLQENEGEI